MNETTKPKQTAQNDELENKWTNHKCALIGAGKCGVLLYIYTHTQHLWTCVQCFEGICMPWKLLCSSASATAAITLTEWREYASARQTLQSWQQKYKRNFLCNLMLDFTWCCGKSWAAKNTCFNPASHLRCRDCYQGLNPSSIVITGASQVLNRSNWNIVLIYFQHFTGIFVANPCASGTIGARYTHVFICLSKQITSNNENYT